MIILKLNYLFIYIGLIVSILLLSRFKKHTKPTKVFILFFFFYFLSEIIAFNLYNWFKIYNHWYYNLKFLIEFAILSYFYYFTIEKNNYKKLILASFYFIVGFIILKYLLIYKSIIYFHYIDIYLTKFPIFLYSVYYIYSNYTEKKELYLANIGITFLYLIEILKWIGSPITSILIDNNTYLSEFTGLYENFFDKSLQFIAAPVFLVLTWINFKQIIKSNKWN